MSEAQANTNPEVEIIQTGPKQSEEHKVKTKLKPLDS